MSASYGPWKPTPWWLRAVGKPAFCRSVYASPMIGEGWDGFEYADIPFDEPASPEPPQEA